MRFAFFAISWLPFAVKGFDASREKPLTAKNAKSFREDRQEKPTT